MEHCEMRGHIGDLSEFKAHWITEALSEAHSRNSSFIPNEKSKNCKGEGVKLLNLYLVHVSADTCQQHLWPSL